MSGIKITGEEAAVASAVELVKETLGLDEAGARLDPCPRGGRWLLLARVPALAGRTTSLLQFEQSRHQDHGREFRD